MSKKTFRSRSSDHVPVVPTMVSTNPVGVKRIHVFRNGDTFFPGIQVVVNTHRVPSIDVLLDVISDRIGLINGAKKIYTTGGTLVKDINKIRDGENYVASSSHFTPMAYGGQIAQKEIKKKKKRAKTVDGRVKKKVKEVKEEVEEEIRIPFNDTVHEEKEKKKKKKKVVRKDHGHHQHHRKGSAETLETAEVELPSEVEGSEEEEEDDHHGRHSEEEDHHRPSTGHSQSHHSLAPSRSVSRRGSRHEEPEKKEKREEKRRKSVSKPKNAKNQNPQQGQPNWGDLSSFTKNIESLLRN